MNKSILAVAVTIASLTLAGCGTEVNQAAQQQKNQRSNEVYEATKPSSSEEALSIAEQ